MQSPSKIFQEMNIALAFCVKFPGLSTMLCFQSIKYFKNYYCNQSKRSSFSLVNGAKKGVRFFSCSFSFMFVFFYVRFLSCSFSFMFVFFHVQSGNWKKSQHFAVLCQFKCFCITKMLHRGGSRTAATSKMKRFVIIVNGWKLLTIITKHSILDFAAALDPPLLQTFPADSLRICVANFTPITEYEFNSFMTGVVII